jgi:hypothetical protein
MGHQNNIRFSPLKVDAKINKEIVVGRHQRWNTRERIPIKPQQKVNLLIPNLMMEMFISRL